jgi:hypothetical protein
MQAPEGGWKLCIGAFIDCHPDWLICGTAEGYTARRRGPRGRFVGPVLTGISLDELGAKIAAAVAAAGKRTGSAL